VKPKLNVQAVKDWLKENDQTGAWFARRLGVDESTFYYRLENKSPLDVDKIAAIMGVADPKDLIEMVE